MRGRRPPRRARRSCRTGSRCHATASGARSAGPRFRGRRPTGGLRACLVGPGCGPGRPAQESCVRCPCGGARFGSPSSCSSCRPDVIVSDSWVPLTGPRYPDRLHHGGEPGAVLGVAARHGPDQVCWPSRLGTPARPGRHQDGSVGAPLERRQAPVAPVGHRGWPWSHQHHWMTSSSVERIAGHRLPPRCGPEPAVRQQPGQRPAGRRVRGVPGVSSPRRPRCTIGRAVPEAASTARPREPNAHLPDTGQERIRRVDGPWVSCRGRRRRSR